MFLISKPILPVYAIVAMTNQRVIGVDEKLPWHLPEDLKHFSSLTKGSTVLMGRKTFDSLPAKYKPLPERLNMVLSRSKQDYQFDNVKSFTDLNQISLFCENRSNLKGNCIWVIGGEQIYRVTMPWWEKVFVTKVNGNYTGDAYFPEFEKDFQLVESKPATGCNFETYERIA